MNPNNPHYFEGDRLPVIINIQKKFKTGIVKTPTGKKFPVKLQDWLIDGIMLMDYVELKKSKVTGEWIVTNYFINNEVYAAIHNSYQENYNDMIVDERGVPYE